MRQKYKKIIPATGFWAYCKPRAASLPQEMGLQKNGRAAEMYREIILSRHSGDIVNPESRAPVIRNHTQNTQRWSPLT